MMKQETHIQRKIIVATKYRSAAAHIADNIPAHGPNTKPATTIDASRQLITDP